MWDAAEVRAAGGRDIPQGTQGSQSRFAVGPYIWPAGLGGSSVRRQPLLLRAGHFLRPWKVDISNPFLLCLSSLCQKAAPEYLRLSPEDRGGPDPGFPGGRAAEVKTLPLSLFTSTALEQGLGKFAHS